MFTPFSLPPADKIPFFALYDPSHELIDYLNQRNIPFKLLSTHLDDVQVVMLNGSNLQKKLDQDYLNALSEFVSHGGVLILQEPESGVMDDQQLKILNDLELNIQYRKDPERGGYDSYVFPNDTKHFLWQGISPHYLKLFNGALGGEMVSQHNLRPSVPFNSLADCNIALKVSAVLEIPYGKGWVIISRIQIRGRMLLDKSSPDLHDRRYDPVAERYFWNLLTGYLNQDVYHDKVQQELREKPIYIARIRASSGQIYDAIDGKMSTRWSSKAEDPQWLWIDFGRPTPLKKLTIYWEVAYGKVYEIYQSTDNRKWQLIFQELNSDGEKDEIPLQNFEARYLRIDFKKRGTQWGYSIWEMEFE